MLKLVLSWKIKVKVIIKLVIVVVILMNKKRLGYKNKIILNNNYKNNLFLKRVRIRKSRKMRNLLKMIRNNISYRIIV